MTDSDPLAEGDLTTAESVGSADRAGDDQWPPFAITDSVLRQVGGTPLVAHPADDVLCKMERQSPTLSHKDRLAVGMLLALKDRGELADGQRVVEASSGNMAGGVALACNRLGHPCTIVSPETASPIKMGFVKALGAELIQVPAVSHDDEDYYQKQAARRANESDALYLNQYERALNREVHAAWTGPELWAQIEDRPVTHVVAATGSGGTISGIGAYVGAQDDSIRIVAVDAEHSNVSRDFYGQEREEYETEIEGLGQYRTTEAIEFDAIDEMVSVADDDAVARAKSEAADHGLLLGLSSGAVMEVARSITAEDDDACVVAVVHDGAEQYFHQVEGW
ncbi:PLP-dependent cysteine synthase family protein [Saliphagus sp. LR7]|uniref:PLP-dependent cysteine synthase family protein n=1 Tax=Saliphagus sp. LR7 TaxID=2282654 RepID=UPI000DF788A1|nr:pyridoxal-phosphate dependent enzyme [Saliphagus sp. LR7]